MLRPSMSCVPINPLQMLVQSPCWACSLLGVAKSLLAYGAGNMISGRKFFPPGISFIERHPPSMDKLLLSTTVHTSSRPWSVSRCATHARVSACTCPRPRMPGAPRPPGAQGRPTAGPAACHRVGRTQTSAHGMDCGARARMVHAVKGTHDACEHLMRAQIQSRTAHVPLSPTLPPSPPRLALTP